MVGAGAASMPIGTAGTGRSRAGSCSARNTFGLINRLAVFIDAVNNKDVLGEIDTYRP